MPTLSLQSAPPPQSTAGKQFKFLVSPILLCPIKLSPLLASFLRLGPIQDMAPLTITIQTFSDTLCPWCYIGKKDLDRAMELYKGQHPDVQFEVMWNPFYLDPKAKVSGEQATLPPSSLLSLHILLQSPWPANITGMESRRAGVGYSIERKKGRENHSTEF